MVDDERATEPVVGDDMEGLVVDIGVLFNIGRRRKCFYLVWLAHSNVSSCGW